MAITVGSNVKNKDGSTVHSATSTGVVVSYNSNVAKMVNGVKVVNDEALVHWTNSPISNLQIVNGLTLQ